MENQRKDGNLESLPTGVFELPGEPAVVINGVPPVTHSDGNRILCETVSDLEAHKNTISAEWLVGRKVQKIFGEKLYNGKVMEFDKEAGWYRVVYDDGDFEDLEWHELQEVLLPLDISVRLKTIASNVIKKSQEHGKISASTPSHHQVK